ncbi:hypothetical protein FOMPIDRAFT_1112440 [Fomitopsis schrenkii]|uniref:Uncharacterized protein n=1 Tax=Fomitopsis schrenkii TaxID=2126942 RepID=S8ELG7_FOMSC|nr:hypothetical protein FOMPIDRAFT_1112440 [Fomitopsis schrenkii]
MASAVIVDADIVAALRDAVHECGERGLIVASKWASELLLGIPDPKRRAPPPPNQAIAAPITQPRHPHAPPLQPLSEAIRQQEKAWEEEDRDYITTARALVDGKDFVRSASEKQALRDWYKLDKTRHQPTLPINTSLTDLLEMVKNATDPFLLFLKALFLCRLTRREEAIESALLSIASYPWNWSTWMVLGECLGDGEEMFQVKTLNIFHSPSDNELGLCDRLLGEELFPRSLWIMSLRAGVLYHMHDFKEAANQFQKIFAADPYRIDDIDIYSNILYVTEDQSALSTVAHEFTIIDKDRPEICCLIGNYFSLRNEHEKAIKYFRRATQLDRTYLSAWTLMGHEYVEMKNSHAAIEAYRKAVDVNRKDYRAWYGLGQAYELLSMHQYALHYYQRATALRPYDVRIWQAQGICYEEMTRPREAIECFKRALIGADPYETTIHLKLAKLHNDTEQYAEAASYHRRVIDVCRAANKPVAEYAKSSVYVARYHVEHGGGDLALAKELLEPIAASNAEELSTPRNGETTRDLLPNGRGSSYATPAPELQTPIIASSSTLDVDPITVDDEPLRPTNARKTRARYRPFPDLETVMTRAKRRAVAKGRSTDEDDFMTQTAIRFASRLTDDHSAVLYPDVEEPFTDVQDVIRRLLPYHVFQIPKEDLTAMIDRPLFSSAKGKSKATEADYVCEDIAETKFAIQCWKRRRALEERFRRVRIQEGKRASPDDQAYVLAQAVLEAERAETAAVNAELRAARSELEKIGRERRATAPPPTPQAAPRPTTFYPTAASTPSPYASQYRGYTYPYATPYGTTQYTLSPAFQTPTYTTTPGAQRPVYGTAYTPATPSATSTVDTTTTAATLGASTASSPASAASVAAPQPYYRAHTSSAGTAGTISAIPVQLPVTHLPALKAIGLDPVPVSSLPPSGQPRPAAILRSQTATTLQIDINVASLQSAQMNGLALILNTLTSRGVNVDGNTGSTPTVGNTAPKSVSATTDAATAT